MSRELTGELLAIFSAFFWAGGAAIYKKGLEKTDAWSGNLMRTGFTSLGFLVLMLVKGTLFQSINILNLSLVFWLIVSSFFAFFLGDYLYLASLKGIGVSRAVPVSSTFPLFVAVWSFIIYRKPISILVILGTLLIILAIKLISEEKENFTPKEHEDYRKGIAFSLFASICWSISIIILDYLTQFLPSEAVAGLRFMISFLMVTAIVSKRGFNYNPSSMLWIGVGGMVVLVFSNYAFVEAIRIIGSAKVAPVSSTYPVISALFASIFLKEKLTTKIIAGTLLSFSGVMIVISG
jgi:DME family drug/metabolite transporter